MSIFGSIGKLFEKARVESSMDFTQPTPLAVAEMEQMVSQPFIDNSDGTVTDERTGLMWMRVAEGQEWIDGSFIGQANTFTLYQAKDIRRNFAGFEDWRLPTIDELKSIIDPERSRPAFDSLVFLGYSEIENTRFWTSSESNNNEPWLVSFCFGTSYTIESQIDLKRNHGILATNTVRLVRNFTLAEENRGEIHSAYAAVAKPSEILSNVNYKEVLVPSDLDISAQAAQTEVNLRSFNTSEEALVQNETKVIDLALVVPPINLTTPQFIDNGDGTVTDSQTCLMWMRFAEGQNWAGWNCTGQAKRFSLDEAKSIRSNYAGFEDWRLPTIDELKSIVDISRNNPAIDTTFFIGFDGTPNTRFWTSTEADNNEWWTVSFYSGISYTSQSQRKYPNMNTNSVRLVRNDTHAGKCGAGITLTAIANLDYVLTSTNYTEELVALSDLDISADATQIEAYLRRLNNSQETLLQIEMNGIDSEPVLPQINLSTPRYIDNGDGTVTDSQTFLMWMRFIEGQQWLGGSCTRDGSTYTFEAAKAIHRNFAGHDDWRLPTVTELTGIFDSSPIKSPRDARPFLTANQIVGVGSVFWTSTCCNYSTVSGIVAGVHCVNYSSGKNFITTQLGQCLVLLVHSTNDTELLVSETVRKSLRAALTECDVPRGDLINFVHKFPSRIDQGLFENGKTLLHLAAQAGKLEIVEWLVSVKSAKVDIYDSQGKTPFDLATAAGFTHTAKFLRRKYEQPEALVQVETKLTNLAIQPKVMPYSLGYIVNENGTVLDTSTGLTWMRFVEGQTWSNGNSHGSPKYFSWNAALAISRKYSDYDDWRLPSITELKTIIKKNCANPSIDKEIFPSTPGSDFWSSSRSGGNSYWGVNFLLGSDRGYSPTVCNYVRLVRGGYCLRTNMSGSEFGLITAEPASDFHSGGSVLTLTATPPLGSVFLGWSGDLIGSNSTCTLIMDSDKQITANFEEKSFPLQIKQTGSGTGLINRSPAQPIGEDDCQSYPAGTSVTLIASHAPDSTFTGWAGDASGSNPILILLMGAGKSVSANFLLKSFALSLSKSGTGSGTFTPIPNFSHTAGSLVTLTANPKNGSEFRGWSGDVTESTLTCCFVMNSAKAIIANFELQSFALGITTSGTGIGTIARSLKSENYEYGTTVALTAHAADGSIFNGWHDDASGLDATCTVLIDAAKSVSANFMLKPFKLSLSKGGTGSGTFTPMPEGYSHTVGSLVTLTAIPKHGSEFRGWSGDVTESALTCCFVMNSAKAVIANFELQSFALGITTSGTGTGTIARSLKSENYEYGTTVTLTAHAADGSIFNGWHNDASGLDATCTVLIDSAKSVSANFMLKPFKLSLAKGGKGSGTFMPMPEGYSHTAGSLVTLTANPKHGSAFSGWTGDVMDSAPTCCFVMDSAKAVTANFDLRSFALGVTTSGSGAGTISRSPESENYEYGATVTLTAHAAEGSIFNGWHDDASGLNATCTVLIDSAKRVTADFERLDIAEMSMSIAFDSCENASMKSGDDAFLVYLSIANKGQKQIHVELPMSSYLKHTGEELEQDAWLTGLVNGAQGATIRSGAFRKVGLVFFKSKLKEISTSDHLYVTVSQAKPVRRFNFSFRCTDQKSRAFTLIHAVEDALQVQEEVISNFIDLPALLQRIEFLEAGMSELLRKFDPLRIKSPAAAGGTASNVALPQPFPNILAWLVTQDRVSIAVLRERLLPLDLLPSAVIDEINERSLDLTGEPALEEVGEQILVMQTALADVLANWQERA